jgi:hypothetical protein
MAKAWISTYVNLSDYFSKYGFGDGDDGVALYIGQDLQVAARNILLRQLAKHAGVQKIEVKMGESSSLHNDCTLDLYIGGELVYVNFEDDLTVKIPDAPKQLQAALSAAFVKAHKEFDKLVRANYPTPKLVNRKPKGKADGRK